ncbi:TraG family conjugative transposon ATPase [Chitinophaga defluvii]|uniref:TraG family conjugative transposon ATPase n=1 Tax=Chitinophaga defluvii TaxID=3163343 RepID=A0ABV2T8R0_9BACT
MEIVSIIVLMLVVAAIQLQLKSNRKNSRALEKILPIYKVERDCIISKQGDVTVAFTLDLPEIFTLSAADYETIHHIWVRAIRLLPPGTVIHKQDWYTDAAYQSNFSPDQSFLQRSSERFFHSRPYLNHQCYLMITRKADNRKPASSVFSNLLRSSLVPQNTIQEQPFQDFMDKVSQVQRLLQEGGFIRAHRLTSEDLVGTNEKQGLIERYCFLAAPDQQPVVRDIEFKPEWKVGENYCQMYSLSDVEDLPGLCGSRITYDKYSTDISKFSIGFAAPLGQLLNCNHIYNQFLVVEDSQKTFKKLEAKRRRLQSLSAYSRENAISKDATNAFLNEAISQHRLPVKAHFHVLTWTSHPEQLKELRNKTSAALAAIDANPRQEQSGAPQLYWAGLPGNGADLPLNECFDTFAEQGSCFFTQETNYRHSPSTFGIRLGDRLTGQPIHFDPSDYFMSTGVISNRNKLLIGGSGTGKSLCMAHFMHSYFVQGAHCVIVDVGHSYIGLCKLVNGYYFTYEQNNPFRFNPFFIGEGDTLDTEKKESIKSLLLALWKKDTEVFTRAEYVALSNALSLYFDKLEANKDIFPGFNSFYEFLRDDYAEILSKENVQLKDFDINNFLYVLRPYYKNGEFDFLLNATENLSLLQQPFIVFELDNIKDHPILFPVVTLIIMELFVSKMRKLKGTRKVIVIEEAWKAIAKAGMADFIKYLYKTVRKHFGEAIVVTQELDDVISSPIIKEAIINNADCKILMDMRKFQHKFAQIQTVLGLTDKGRDILFSVNRGNDPKRRYREIYFDLGGVVQQVFAFEPCLEEYYAYTTEEKEKIKVQQYAAKFNGNIARGITALVTESKQ